MENSWKNYRFGFDVGAALLFAAIMLPNIYWFAVPAPNDILRGASVTPTIDTIGSVFQMLMVGLHCILKNTTAGMRTKYLWGVAVCYGIYCAAWIAYYRGIVMPAVILALCLAPCLAFGFYSAGWLILKRELESFKPIDLRFYMRMWSVNWERTPLQLLAI